ncbi:VagD (plasmid) [Kluyvera intermedia]|uniref:VagD n=1 Tax=Kluyvera intermedia TaxID=61648 RepID=A0ABX3U7K6_KLUIN|nr:VagD [Kluyvera intermedia]
MNKIYMLDTNICSFIMREQSEVVLKRLEPAVLRDQRIVVSVITYSEMRFGATGALLQIVGGDKLIIPFC